MFTDYDRRSRDSDGATPVFRGSIRCSGLRNGFAHSKDEEKRPIPSKPEGNGAISEAVIRDELTRILKSSMFVQSERLSRFLRFTVFKVLAGEGGTLKEYLIGTEVYGRPASYRPSEDSIVRSEARRLRSKLREYYESDGTKDPIVIDYRPGSYAPFFRSPHRSGSNANPSSVPPKSLHRGYGNGIRIAVLPFVDASGVAGSGFYAQLITDELIHELARTNGILVTAASSIAPLLEKAVDVRTLARALDVQIVFEGTVRQDNNLLRITSRIVDPADGFQIWSERINTEPTLQDLPLSIAKIALSLLSHIRT